MAIVGSSGRLPQQAAAAPESESAGAAGATPAPKPEPPAGKGEEGKSGFSLPGSRSSGPIHVDAKVLEFDARTDVATFRGDVVTKQDDVVMHSAVLRVVFVPSEGIGNLDQLQTVVAEGDVRITQGDRIARGERAEFDDAARTLVLSGGAVLLEGSNEIRGERVIVYLDEERSVVEGTNSRVKAVLVPHGDGGASGAKSDGTQGKRGKRREKNAGTPGRGGAGAAMAAESAGTTLGDVGTVLDEEGGDEGQPE